MEGISHTTDPETDWDRADTAGRALMLAGAVTEKKMDQNRLNKLLEEVTPRDQIDLKVLHNAVISCLKDYTNDSTVSKLKDWKAAQKAGAGTPES